MSLEDTLRVRREACGLGQAELAQALGVSQQTVSRWESGQGLPRPRRITQLAEQLGLDAERLHRLAGFLPQAPDAGTASGLPAVLDLVGDLTEDELGALIEHSWKELRGRQSGRTVVTPRRSRP